MLVENPALRLPDLRQARRSLGRRDIFFTGRNGLGINDTFQVFGVVLLQMFEGGALVRLVFEPLLEELHAASVLGQHLAPGLHEDADIVLLVDQAGLVGHAELRVRADIVADDPEHP